MAKFFFLVFALFTILAPKAQAQDPQGLPVFVPVAQDIALLPGNCWLSAPPGWEQHAWRITIHNQSAVPMVVDIGARRQQVMVPLPGTIGFAPRMTPVTVNGAQHRYSPLMPGEACFALMEREPEASAFIPITAWGLSQVGPQGPEFFSGQEQVLHTDYRLSGRSVKRDIRAVSRHPQGTQVRVLRSEI